MELETRADISIGQDIPEAGYLSDVLKSSETVVQSDDATVSSRVNSSQIYALHSTPSELYYYQIPYKKRLKANHPAIIQDVTLPSENSGATVNSSNCLDPVIANISPISSCDKQIVQNTDVTGCHPLNSTQTETGSPSLSNSCCCNGSSEESNSSIPGCSANSSQEEKRGRRLSRKKKPYTQENCPICDVTVRTTELKSHYEQEIAKLSAIPNRTLKKPPKEGQSINKSFEQVKQNRENRLTAKVARYKKRRQNEIHCPVCNIELTGTQEELTDHVENCLNQCEITDSESDNIDIEGDDTFEEYEWAGQTRTRAVSLVEGGSKALPGDVIRHSSVDDTDQDLNVDSDDTLAYGQPQYTEHDIILPSTSKQEDKERERLRNAVLFESSGKPQVLETNKWSSDRTADIEPCSNTLSKDNEDNLSHNEAYQVITSLKEKIKDLEDQQQSNDGVKCLICMEPYDKPVVSVTCWHVHCEECWLMSMGVKKLCPQCNMIVFPSDLRRIYL